MKIPKIGLGLFCLASLGFVAPGYAQTDDMTVGRYLTVEETPLPAQTDLLSQTFQVHFPANIKTIGDATRYLLRFSGYSLINEKALSPPAQALLKQPLPAVDRNFGPMSLQQGLLTLAGGPFGLVVDPVHRLISFRLKPNYRSVFSQSVSVMKEGK